MAEKQPLNNADEIDLGQLFQVIGKGFNNLFRAFLKFFLYLRKNIIILLALVLGGAAVGYILSKVVSKQYKTEVIVSPQLESKNYLYEVISEIQSNIKAKDTLFFKSLGVENIDFNGLEVNITRVIDGASTEIDMKYLELLQGFNNTDAIADIVRTELQNNSSYNHLITFQYKDAQFGTAFARKMIDYINTNKYFNELVKVYRSNASYRIQENETLLEQVDEIIINYTNSLATKGSTAVTERIVLDNQEQVNIADIFEYKTLLIRDIEAKKLELVKLAEPISVVNFGKSQVVQKSFFGKNIVLIPMILLFLFFFISFVRYLNIQTKEL